MGRGVSTAVGGLGMGWLSRVAPVYKCSTNVPPKVNLFVSSWLSSSYRPQVDSSIAVNKFYSIVMQIHG